MPTVPPKTVQRGQVPTKKPPVGTQAVSVKPRSVINVITGVTTRRRVEKATEPKEPKIVGTPLHITMPPKRKKKSKKKR